MECSLDSRLTVRVLQVWKELATAGLAKRSQIDPRDFGPDWSNCFVIDLDPIVPQSRFSYVGNALRDLIPVTFEGKTFSELHKETLLKLLNPHILRVMTDKMPVKFAGSAAHDNKDILYRTVLMPLSEIGDQVDGLVAATSYREISVQKELPAAEHTVGHRHGGGNSQSANATHTTAWG